LRVAIASEPDWRSALERSRGADLVCLPHLSFAPYIAAVRDRAGLELAERAPSRQLREAAALAAGAWVSASAYESEGEGVFYVTAYLAAGGTLVPSSRQRHVEAAPGRYEQMYWSPGHEPPVPVELPCGRSAAIAGADLRAPESWRALAALGVRCVFGGASEPPELWDRTLRIAAGMAAAYGMTVLAANRADGGFAGGAAAFGRDGAPLERDAEGLYVV
jgi:predicted amidohydrolase